MVFPSDLPSLPDPNTRTESDGLTLRQKLAAILSGYKTYIEALGAKVGIDGSAVTTSLDYKVNALSLIPETVYTASHVLDLTNAGKAVALNVGSANTLTVPPNSSVAFPVGTVIEILQYGSGQTTITPGVGVILRSNGSKLKLSAQYAVAGMRKRDTNEWVVSGDLIT